MQSVGIQDIYNGWWTAIWRFSNVRQSFIVEQKDGFTRVYTFWIKYSNQRIADLFNYICLFKYIVSFPPQIRSFSLEVKRLTKEKMSHPLATSSWNLVANTWFLVTLATRGLQFQALRHPSAIFIVMAVPFHRKDTILLQEHKNIISTLNNSHNFLFILLKQTKD